jgi:hypothetical protein
LYQNEEGIEGKLTLGTSTSLISRVRLVAAAPFLQSFETVRGSSKASLAPKHDERWWWMLLVNGVSFNLQELTKIMSSAKVLSFDDPNTGR